MTPITPSSLDGVFGLLFIDYLAQVAPDYILPTLRHLIFDRVHFIQLTPQVFFEAGLVIEVVLILVGEEGPIVHEPAVE